MGNATIHRRERDKRVSWEVVMQLGNDPVTIPPRLVKALRDHKVKQNERRLLLGDRWQDNDLVFPANNGKPANANNITRNYNIMIERAGITRIRIHDLRHTHATWLGEEGLDMKAVQDRLGHSKSSVTIDFYGHITPRMDAHTLEAVSGRWAILSPSEAGVG